MIDAHSMYLPTELIERIIDHLHDDKATLSSFCLTAKTFVNRSRFHIWWRLTISSFSNYLFISDLFKSPSSPIFHYVKELRLSPVKGCAHIEDAKTLTTLERFTSVQTLELHSFLFREISFPTATRLSHAYRNITQLRLTYVVFHTRTQLGEFINAMSRLRSLVLYMAICEDSEGDPVILPPTIEELQLDFSMSPRTLDLSIAAPTASGFHSLTNLCLLEIGPTRVEIVNAVLRAVGATLKRLFLNYVYYIHEDEGYTHAHYTFDFSHNTGLRRVILREASCAYGQRELNWIADLLLKLGSSWLEVVRIEMSVRTMVELNRRCISRAVSWLTVSRFPRLRKISIFVERSFLEGDNIRLEYKEWEEAGLLEVGFLKLRPGDKQWMFTEASATVSI